MPTYAIGDVHGCYRTLQKLLERIKFDATEDYLWLVGDLVNRGPGSLEVLRWAREHDSLLTVVLGNHDLNLLGRAAGVRPAKPADTLDELLGAPDRDELLSWLRHRPFLHREGRFVLVHAGLLPSWTLDKAVSNGQELAAAMQSARYNDVLDAIYSKGYFGWPGVRKARKHWRALADIFTRLRMCTPDGEPFYDYTEAPEEAPDGYLPWFRVPGRRDEGVTILFGHWAALDVRIGRDFVALDSGCAWGGPLTAVRLPELTVFQEPNADMD